MEHAIVEKNTFVTIVPMPTVYRTRSEPWGPTADPVLDFKPLKLDAGNQAGRSVRVPTTPPMPPLPTYLCDNSPTPSTEFCWTPYETYETPRQMCEYPYRAGLSPEDARPTPRLEYNSRENCNNWYENSDRENCNNWFANSGRENGNDWPELGYESYWRSNGEGEPVSRNPCSKVFIGGLAAWTTSRSLKAAFAETGPVSRAAVLLDGHGRSRGFGFVTFAGGVPEGVAGTYHFVDGRWCGARLYDYPKDNASEDGRVEKAG